MDLSLSRDALIEPASFINHQLRTHGSPMRDLVHLGFPAQAAQFLKSFNKHTVNRGLFSYTFLSSLVPSSSRKVIIYIYKLTENS